jgi:3-oxoadipate enol-lactonase
MRIIQQGAGDPVVLIPGIHGKWEYLRPAVDALSRSWRVITFPLCGEPESGVPFERARGFEADVAQVASVLDELHIERAVICGVSFGGLIALRFAAAYPERTRALILASTPGPAWRLRTRHAVYARLPRLFGPLFLLEAPRRLRRELMEAFPDPALRRAFLRWQLQTVAAAALSLTRMGGRALMIASADPAATAARISSPTLVVTGERGLDHVAPVQDTLDYLRAIRDARGVVLEHTGHLGTITRPDEFATAVREFLSTLEGEHRRTGASRRAHATGIARDGTNDAA